MNKIIKSDNLNNLKKLGTLKDKAMETIDRSCHTGIYSKDDIKEGIKNIYTTCLNDKIDITDVEVVEQPDEFRNKLSEMKNMVIIQQDKNIPLSKPVSHSPINVTGFYIVGDRTLNHISICMYVFYDPKLQDIIDIDNIVNN